jgi:Kef-type K+ transport system membrane component KefB
VDVHSYAQASVLTLGGLLIAVAIVSKVVAGFAPVWFRGRKLVVGIGMIPRGEVGLIFAQMGRSSGVLDPGLFAALTLMVMVSTFVTPPALKALVSKGPRGPGDAGATAELVTEA